jgi:hypothetical protein
MDNQSIDIFQNVNRELMHKIWKHAQNKEFDELSEEENCINHY